MGKSRCATSCPMNRRSFVLRAGLFAGASAIGSSLLGCSEFVINIPCLGPAVPPAPVPGMTYIRASEIGCALDCDLRTGRNKHTGGAATDDGPQINTAMASASATHPITLIVDGGALVSGLFLPAAGYWSIAGLGCGTGFFVKSGTNNDGIHNGTPNAAVPSDPGPPAPPRGANVSLSNFTVNGNRGNGRNGNSTTGMRQGSKETWYFGINLMNLDHVLIENVVVVNSSTFQIRLSNVGNVEVSGCVLQGSEVNSDGLHVDGPANDIHISNCSISTGDDSIALNCPEGHSGNISRVTVTGCTFDSWSLMRLYTASGTNQFSIDTVNVSNCAGTLSDMAFAIGYISASAQNSVTSLTISDSDLTAPTILGICENFGNIALRNITFTPSDSHVAWTPPQSNHTCGFLRPAPTNGEVRCVGSSLSLENCRIMQNGNVDVAAVVLENGSTINLLKFNGFARQTSGSSTLPGLLNIGSGFIGQLVINSLDSGNIKAPVTPGSFSSIGSVSGAGVLATGWKFPDLVMADGVPYLSANSGLPSIKVGGVVEPYTVP